MTETRTVLVHLNVEVPATALGTYVQEDDLAAHVQREIEGALEVGTDDENTPVLAVSATEVVLAEAI